MGLHCRLAGRRRSPNWDSERQGANLPGWGLESGIWTTDESGVRGRSCFPMPLSWWTANPFCHSMWNEEARTEKVGPPDIVQVLSPEPHLQVTGFHLVQGLMEAKKGAERILSFCPYGRE